MTTPYEKGRAAEEYIASLFKNAGAFVMRSAGSKGPADLLIVTHNEVLLIQVKTRNASRKERERLISLANKMKARPVIARKLRKYWILEFLDEPLGGSFFLSDYLRRLSL